MEFEADESKVRLNKRENQLTLCDPLFNFMTMILMGSVTGIRLVGTEASNARLMSWKVFFELMHSDMSNNACGETTFVMSNKNNYENALTIYQSCC